MFVISASPAEVAAATATSAPASPRKPWWRRISWTPYFYILPALALLIVWVYKPLIETFQLSFFSWNMLPTAPKQYVGWDNYQYLLGYDKLGNAVVNTLIYIGAFLIASVLVPFVIVLLSRRVSGRAKSVYQALIFVPFLVTPIASAATWRWLFEGRDGAIPVIIRALFGVDVGNMLQSPTWAILVIIIICSWQMLGFGVLVMSAGMSGISPDYAEAAAVDGAGEGRILWNITMPLLSSTIMFLILMTVLLAAQWTFPMLDILTQGGPVDSTTNVYYLLFQLAFSNFDTGLTGAAGVLFFLVFGALAVGLVTLADKLSFYDN